MPAQMPYSLLGQDNADNTDHVHDEGFLARVEPPAPKPSVLTHLRWLGLGVLIGCTGLTIYQIGFDSESSAPSAISSQPTPDTQQATSRQGSPIVSHDSPHDGSSAYADTSAETRHQQPAVIRQGSADGQTFADSMAMMPPNAAADTGSSAPSQESLSAASEQTAGNNERTIGADYPTALLADSLQLSGPSLPSSTARKASSAADNDPDVAILQLLLQRIDKKE